jgi:hypothetical protein
MAGFTLRKELEQRDEKCEIVTGRTEPNGPDCDRWAPLGSFTSPSFKKFWLMVLFLFHTFPTTSLYDSMKARRSRKFAKGQFRWQ